MENEIKTGGKKADRDFEEVEGGQADEMGFYFTPNGSNYIR